MDRGHALELLGLEPGASAQQLREAYRDLAKVWHPDRFANDQRLREKANKQLKAINEAYALLRDDPSEDGTPGPAGRTRERPREADDYSERLRKLIDRAEAAHRRQKAGGAWQTLFLGALAFMIALRGRGGIVLGAAVVAGLVGMLRAAMTAPDRRRRLLQNLVDVCCWSCGAGVVSEVAGGLTDREPRKAARARRDDRLQPRHYPAALFSRIAAKASWAAAHQACPKCGARWCTG